MLDDACYEKVGLSFSARGLPKLDTFSQTDPFVAVFILDNKTRQLQLLGRTGVIMDTPNPDWPEHMVMNYKFEETQQLVVRCYHKTGSASLDNINAHTFIGEISFTVANLMCARSHAISSQMTGGYRQGTLFARGESIHDTRDVFVATFSAEKLLSKNGFFGKSDPFLIISRGNEDGSFTVCWRNQPIMNNLNPRWPPSRISMIPLCNGDIDRPLRIEVFDYEKSGRHQPMGIVDTSVRALVASAGQKLNVVEMEKKKKSSSYVNSGVLSCNGAYIEKHPSMTDFIIGGCEISLMVAIDFTGSNGDPQQSDSLHYCHLPPTQLNPYQHALSSIGNIVESYDSDKMFPVFGFGAKVRTPQGTWSPVQHCFPVYGGGQEVHGVSGIMQAYTDCLQNVALSGPTLFTPVIETAAGIAAAANCTQESQKYFILLIITDGAINDMDSTIGALIRASVLPLSIIIVGVGSADFSSMVALDSDGKMLSQGGKSAARDIVQFVPYNQALRQGPLALAEETLKEVPTQLLQFMRMKNILPKPADPATMPPRC